MFQGRPVSVLNSDEPDLRLANFLMEAPSATI